MRRGTRDIRGAARAALGRLALGALALVLPAAAHAQSAATQHTPADVAFMQGMIQHHSQAVQMVALVPSRTQRPDLKLLAMRIDVSQTDEMEMMRLWLKDRGQAVPDSGAHSGHGAHGGHGLMPGMLSPEEMAALERATGAEFDRLFLEGMIKHHEGALVMVEELFATPGAGQETAIFSFASDVDADQRAEIDRMRKLLAVIAGRGSPAPGSTPRR